MRLGAHPRNGGVEFAVYSSAAEQVELCLFDDAGNETRVPMEQQEGYVWTARVPQARRYGYRVGGGLLIDPYARAIDGRVEWNGGGPPTVPHSVVVDDDFDWGDDAHPGTPLAESIIYELHVKGFTKLHPDVPEELRGTYAGLGQPAVTDHLTRLGVTAVELLPVHQFAHDRALVARGLRNYWGYQSIGYFAPHNEYAAVGRQVAEFKAMVKALHAAGLEVILDVVFNHTAEGGADGPTLSLRGLDAAAYYRIDDAGRYVDDTGCGNTVDTHREPALRMVLDSLRYWREEMHVDGFRFDLAAALGRASADFDPHGAFLQAVGQDPVLSEVKLIAEPWDIGAGGYDVGAFPPGWSEWNGRYRDTVRDFWRGRDGTLPDFATRLAGSSDLYGHGGRRPTASVNLVTVHDGFTLNDLVSYDHKHNEANGEEGRDGTDDNRSWNCGAEGPTEDPAVDELRARQRRNLLATLLLSRGVPLLLGGDEIGRTQGGNNNAYCQDNETSWVDWSRADDALTDFTARLCRLRRSHPAFSRRWDLHGEDDLAWFRPDGAPMTGDDWQHAYAHAVTLVAKADDGTVAVISMINAWSEPVDFRVPVDGSWAVAIDTAGGAPQTITAPGDIELGGRSLVVLEAA